MAWSERQLALLREMGLTLWWPGAAPRGAGAADRRRLPAQAVGVAQADAPTQAGAADRPPAMTGGAHAGAASVSAPVSASMPASMPAPRPALAGKVTADAGAPLIATEPAAAARPGYGGQVALGHAASHAPAESAEPAEPAAPPARLGLRGTALPSTPVSPATAPTGTRPPGIERMDWPALRQAVAGCTACALCQGRTQTVFGVGNERAHWMVVGEAPGEQEDLQGEPFVGRSGQLLDRMLAAIGLTRADAPPGQQVFIANTLKCRPPGNRNPQPAEMAQCEPYLLRQIELIQPRIILAMGRFAVQSLLRSDQPIGRLRGQVHRYHGVPLVVTYHPAYLLRNPADKALAWSDLCLARATLAAQAGAAG